MNEPWAPEYRLQLLEVERILSDNTELEVKDVVVLDEGWDFFCYLINETFVFRFPKRRAEVERLIEEKALLAKLNLTTKTPHFDFWVDRPVGFHLPFAGYPLLSGTPLFEISKVDVDPNVIGSQLGQALRELHAQMLTPSRPPHDPVTEWLPGAQNELENIANVIDCSLFEVCGRLLTSYRPRNPSERQVTTHGDLHAGHVLVMCWSTNRANWLALSIGPMHIRRIGIPILQVCGHGAATALSSPRLTATVAFPRAQIGHSFVRKQSLTLCN